jgi:hypothetical protein
MGKIDMDLPLYICAHHCDDIPCQLVVSTGGLPIRLVWNLHSVSMGGRPGGWMTGLRVETSVNNTDARARQKSSSHHKDYESMQDVYTMPYMRRQAPGYAES